MMRIRKHIISLLLIVTIFPTIHVAAQVNIGSEEKPVSGALLQLKSQTGATDGAANATKGLAMPRVELISINNLYPMFEADGADYKIGATKYSKATEDKKHIGLVVYNTSTTEDLKEGMCAWDGAKWIALKGGTSPWLNFGTTLTASSNTEHIYQMGAVSIGTGTPGSTADSSAVFEVNSSNQGVLLPRITLKSETDKTSIKTNNPANGLLVYNTGNDTNFPISGFMFWNGQKWRLLSDASTVKPQLAGGLIENSAVLTPNSYTANQDYEGILEIGYIGGNGGYYSVGESYVDANSGLTLTLQPGKLESTGRFIFIVKGKPKVSSPTAIANVTIKFLGTVLGMTDIGGSTTISAVQYTLYRSQKIASGSTGGSTPVNFGYKGTILSWRRDNDIEIKSISLPETGAYVFSFRLYGSTDGAANVQESAAFYISALKQAGTAPADRPTDILLDIAEMTVSKVNYLNPTYSINLTVSGQAGDKVYFKMARADGFPFMWTLGNGTNNANYNTMANRTSMIYWKL